MRGNSFSNGPGASSYNGNGQGPAAVNPWTGTRLGQHWWWLV